MLIKYYTQDESLIIIDGVRDVHVPVSPSFGDYALEPWQSFDFDDPERLKVSGNTEQGTERKVITYSKDGPCVLNVWGTAYICNDDGKTIEKVTYR